LAQRSSPDGDDDCPVTFQGDKNAVMRLQIQRPTHFLRNSYLPFCNS
jgi:hypothetical protein